MTDRTETLYFDAGYAAFYDMKSITECPYQMGGFAWRQWRDGWTKAQHDYVKDDEP